MSTWIKMRKSLWNDPRVLSVATKLHQAKPTVIGGLFALWSLADTHGESFKGLSTQVLDSEIGIEGFCDALPRDWFVKRGNRIELPNYSAHNGSTAKTRALGTERVARHREKAGNAGVTHEALPDQTRPEKIRKEQPPPADERAALVEYARLFVDLALPVAEVGKLINSYGFWWVVEALEHLASRYPADRFAGIQHPDRFVKSLCKRAMNEDGLERGDYEYRTFSGWTAELQAKVPA